MLAAMNVRSFRNDICYQKLLWDSCDTTAFRSSFIFRFNMFFVNSYRQI